MLTRSAEDCIEAIYKLIKERGYARISDISLILDVQPPSVTQMAQKLKDQGLVAYERYRYIKLTPNGEKLAKSVAYRHRTLTEFLKMLGVNEEMAEEDACRIEHYLHPETMERLTKLVEFIRTAPRRPEWLKHFKYYFKTGKRPRACKEETCKKTA